MVIVRHTWIISYSFNVCYKNNGDDRLEFDKLNLLTGVDTKRESEPDVLLFLFLLHVD